MATITVTGPAGCCCTPACTEGCCLCGSETTSATAGALLGYFSGTGCAAACFDAAPVPCYVVGHGAHGGFTFNLSYSAGGITWTATIECGPGGLFLSSISQSAGYGSIPCRGTYTDYGTPSIAVGPTVCDSSGFASKTWTVTLPDGGGTWLVTLAAP